MYRSKSSTQAYREKMVGQIEGGIKMLIWMIVICVLNIPINFFVDACRAGLGW